MSFRRFLSVVVALALTTALNPLWPLTANAASLRSDPGPSRTRTPVTTVVRGTVPNGEHATIFSNGTAELLTPDRSKVEFRTLSADDRTLLPLARTATDRKLLLDELMRPLPRAYAPQTVNVVFRNGATIAQDVVTLAPATLLSLRKAKAGTLASIAPHLTNDTATNTVLARLGVDRTERIARAIPRGELTAMRERGGTAALSELDITNAFSLHLTGASVEAAVKALQALPTVAYAEPDWTVSALRVAPIPMPAIAQEEAKRNAMLMPNARGFNASAIPSNYGITASLESNLNAPGLDVGAAYDEIEHEFGQLPGEGEIITNVSVGDLDDSTAAANQNDQCNFYAGDYGPTTQVINGQRYLNLPSMPLIPAYAADASGNLSGSAEICGADPLLSEIGLDFSVMAPLPHQMQRSGEIGSGATDLLGIAPGAKYRLVVVGTTQQLATNSYAVGALLGAAAQTPAPSIITASLGFGFDNVGFAGRYLEEDPLERATIETIVHGAGIPVCVAANDGTRDSTNAAIGPSGGSAPTDVTTSYGAQTNLGDIHYSTAPSSIIDSGSIDVGGTTTDDIFALEPQAGGRDAGYTSREPFVETRFDGFTSFSSGEGSRVNVAAPSDNIVSFSHQYGGNYDTVAVNITGGTSAAAPEAAAVAAVALQVARLTHHPFQSPAALRTFLNANGVPVEQPASAEALNVGTQVNLRRIVEALLSADGKHITPSVARVAIAQRRSGGFNFILTTELSGPLDTVYQEDTDPGAIDLQGPADPNTNQASNEDVNAYITIAPDWEGLPANATFRLFANNHPSALLATTRYTRLLPVQILGAAGLPVASTSARTVKLTYEAYSGKRLLTKAPFALTFGAAGTTSELVLAPVVPPLVTGKTIPVRYDFSSFPTALLKNPTLVVSYPGRTNPATGAMFFPAYAVALSHTKGTVDVPVDKLQGGGVYGIGILLAPAPSPYQDAAYSDFAFTRVAPAVTTRPPAPLVAQAGATPIAFTHSLEIPYDAPVEVDYDVSNVKGATGAVLEVSATATHYGLANTFNNPNGTVIDDNGQDSGSIDRIPLTGTKGRMQFKTLGKGSLKLTPAMEHDFRVIPTAGGSPVGEASDVSDVWMDGVVAADGGNLTFGYGINANGNDAFLTSEQTTIYGNVLSSVESFQQSTNAIVNPAIESSVVNEYSVSGWGVFGSDTGVVLNGGPTGIVFSLLNPQAGTMSSNPITFPSWSPAPILAELAPNTTTTTAALFHMPQAYQLNLTTGAFGAPIDLSKDAASGSGDNAYNSFAANNATGDVYTEFYSLNSITSCPPGQILYGNLNSGTVGAFPGPGFNAYQLGHIAVDSTTNKAAIFSACNGSLAMIDLSTHAISQTPISGMAGYNSVGVLYTIIDEPHKIVLVHSAYSPDFGLNNNSISSVFEFDENGHYIGRNENFFFFNTGFQGQDHFLTANPTTRTGYDFGPGQWQLEPFTY